jgi:hypothetical protein
MTTTATGTIIPRCDLFSNMCGLLFGARKNALADDTLIGTWGHVLQGVVQGSPKKFKTRTNVVLTGAAKEGACWIRGEWRILMIG